MGRSYGSGPAQPPIATGCHNSTNALIRQIAAMFMPMPALTMSSMVMYSEANTAAFGGVEIGSMNAQLADSAMTAMIA